MAPAQLGYAVAVLRIGNGGATLDFVLHMLLLQAK